MIQPKSRLNLSLTAALAAILLSAAVSPISAQTQPETPSIEAAPSENRAVDLETLMRELARPDQRNWMRIERQIRREWARSGSDSADYLYGRGQEALVSGDALVAIGHFSALLDHAPDFIEAHAARAQAFYLNGDLGPALADLETVLAHNPRHFDALMGLGAIFEQLERPQDALSAYRAALAIHPHHSQLQEAAQRLALALAGPDI